MNAPREHLENPWAFGDSAPAPSAGSAGTAVGRAALVQSMTMAAVRARIGDRGVSRHWVAQRCGFSDRHLRRIMAGQQWARLTDIAALSQVLEIDLLLLPGAADEEGKRRVIRLREL